MTTGSKSKTPARKSAAKPKAPKPAHKKTATAKLVWREVTCRVRHTPNYLSKGWSHIEIIVQKPKGAPLPITGTGYLSHFLDADLLAKHGGPVTFFLGWLERGRGPRRGRKPSLGGGSWSCSRDGGQEPWWRCKGRNDRRGVPARRGLATP